MQISSRFIAIDGPNGIGKSTIMEGLKDRLQDRIENFKFTKEPTTSSLGTFVREHQNEYTARCLAALVAADRYDHLEKTIHPNLQAGRTVVTDRYIAASLVYQLLDGLSIEFIMQLNSEIILPELCFLLTGDEQEIQSRLNARINLTRFEENNQVKKELALFDQAGVHLESLGVRVVRIKNTGQEKETTITTIINEINTLGKN